MAWGHAKLKKGVKIEGANDDNAFVVHMFCNKKPLALLAAQKNGKIFISNERFRLISRIKFDGRVISVMAVRGGEKAMIYQIEAFNQ